MKLFEEIKRRAHNVARAIQGDDFLPPLAEPKIKFTMPAKVETFAAEQFFGPIIDEFVKPEMVLDCYRRGLAAEIGHKLLDEGIFTEEISQRPHEQGLRGYTMRLTVKVVRPEEARKL